MRTRKWQTLMIVACAGAVALASGAQFVEAEETGAPGVTIYTLANAPAAPKVEDMPLKDSVSEYGITWTFDKPVHVGQFVNGDWYVVGAATIKTIDPKPLFGDEVKDLIDKDAIHEVKNYAGKEARNGSSLNVAAGDGKGGFDSRIPSGRYNPEEFTHLPISMKPGDSVVSTISRPTSAITHFGGQHVDPLSVAAVLSCVAEPEPADAFRPSYADSEHSQIYLARHLHRELLLSLPKMKGMPEDLEHVASRFRKPWLDTVLMGFAAPQQDLPHYGQQMAELVGEGTLLLQMDYTAEQKEKLLDNITQVGIDLWGLVRAGRQWPAHGGLNSGRKWPLVFAGMMLGDADMCSPNTKYPKTRFHEDDQTALGPVTYNGKVYDKSWTGSRAIFMGHSPYLIGKMKDHWERGWGPVDLFPPTEWLPKGKLTASEGYRRANTSAAWVGEDLAARLLHAEKYWDHDAFFAYEDRWMTQDELPISAAMKAAGRGDYSKPGTYGRQGMVTGAAWIKPMWEKYREHLPAAADGSKTVSAETSWK